MSALWKSHTHLISKADVSGLVSEKSLSPSQWVGLAALPNWTRALFIALFLITCPFVAHSQDRTLIVGLAGKCLDVAGGNPADGTRIILWPCRHNAPNQQWTIHNDGTVRGLAGKCL